ncbi:predicted protein [Coccidioides posadasii str. Silveira]|uniref:Predicted protein n=1 Tax=Coccidioides posadasii (strain RMSCC 757 / Silveira) TaxID=443226 RepID=E9CY95_COCPS|nr:predicted protein [Coccidioides posadasii str. Silveira]
MYVYLSRHPLNPSANKPERKEADSAPTPKSLAPAHLSTSANPSSCLSGILLPQCRSLRVGKLDQQPLLGERKPREYEVSILFGSNCQEDSHECALFPAADPTITPYPIFGSRRPVMSKLKAQGSWR